MELGNNKPKYTGEIIKPPLSESERKQENYRQAIKTLSENGSTIGPTILSVTKYAESKIEANSNIDFNDVAGKESTPDFDFDEIKSPKFSSKVDSNSQSADYSNRSINIGGNVIAGNIIQGKVNGNISTTINKPSSRPDRETYLASKEQIAYVNSQDKITIPENKPEYVAEQIADPWDDIPNQQEPLPQSRNEAVISNLDQTTVAEIKENESGFKVYNSLEDVLDEMIAKWEKEAQLPQPQVLKSTDEQWAAIEAKWASKLAVPMSFKGYSQEQPKEVKKLLSKREKIKTVLKNVGNKIAENFKKFKEKYIDLPDEEEKEENDKYEGMEPEERLSETIKDINKNQQSNRYSSAEVKPMGSVTPEMLARREKIAQSKNKIDELKIVSGKVLESKRKIDELTISSEPITEKIAEQEKVEEQVSTNEVLDVKSQTDFINDRLNAFENLNTVDSLELEIQNLEDGTLTIPDLIASESDYEGSDEEVEEKLNKNKEYTDARDINMQKTYEIINALKQKKSALDQVQDINNIKGISGIVYESKTFTVRNRADGSLYATLNNSKDVDKDTKTQIMEVTVDNTGKLKAIQNDGKQFVVSNIQNKIIQQKIEPIKQTLNTRLEDIDNQK